MTLTGSVVLTGATVTMGRWAKGQPLAARPVVALGFMAVMLAALSESQPEFAAQFGTLILVATLFIYGPDIVKKLGLA